MPSITSNAAAAALPPNYVWRSYKGGSVLREFRGQPHPGLDDNFPEDWLASTVIARNGLNSQGPTEGASQLGSGLSLRDAIKDDPQFWFGSSSRADGNQGTGVLWKLLDSSVRLQLQAHPDAAFARQHLNSNAGKTECWYILNTRGDACVYLGFQHPPSRNEWKRMIQEQDVDKMLACFEPIPVRAGDCFVVPAGMPHAIGAGVFMMELQEPTDWVVRCERVTAGLTLPPEACFMGLELERCLDVFTYRARSLSEVRDELQQRPKTLSRTNDCWAEEIIGPAYHEFFRLHRLRGRGKASWAGEEMMLLVVVGGAGELSSGMERLALKSGETCLLPGAAANWDWKSTQGEWELLLAKLPRR